MVGPPVGAPGAVAASASLALAGRPLQRSSTRPTPPAPPSSLPASHPQSRKESPSDMKRAYTQCSARGGRGGRRQVSGHLSRTLQCLPAHISLAFGSPTPSHPTPPHPTLTQPPSGPPTRMEDGQVLVQDELQALLCALRSQRPRQRRKLVRVAVVRGRQPAAGAWAGEGGRERWRRMQSGGCVGRPPSADECWTRLHSAPPTAPQTRAQQQVCRQRVGGVQAEVALQRGDRVLAPCHRRACFGMRRQAEVRRG